MVFHFTQNWKYILMKTVSERDWYNHQYNGFKKSKSRNSTTCCYKVRFCWISTEYWHKRSGQPSPKPVGQSSQRQKVWQPDLEGDMAQRSIADFASQASPDHHLLKPAEAAQLNACAKFIPVKNLTLTSRVLGLWIQVLGPGLEPQVRVNITADSTWRCSVWLTRRKQLTCWYDNSIKSLAN